MRGCIEGDPYEIFKYTQRMCFWLTSNLKKFYIMHLSAAKTTTTTKAKYTTQMHIPFSVIHTYTSVDFVVPLVGRRAVSAYMLDIVLVVVHK